MSFLEIQTKLVVTEDLSHNSHGFTVIDAKDCDQSLIMLNIATAFNSQFAYHFALTTYSQSSFIVVLNLLETFNDFSSQLLTLHLIVSKLPEYNGVNVYSVLQFLNNAPYRLPVGDACGRGSRPVDFGDTRLLENLTHILFIHTTSGHDNDAPRSK